MKKCRNLAVKLKIAVFLPLLVISMLFHVPAEAAENQFTYGNWEQFTVPVDVSFTRKISSWTALTSNTPYLISGMAFQRVDLSDYVSLDDNSFYQFRIDGQDFYGGDNGFYLKENFSYGNYLKEGSNGAFYDLPARGGVVLYDSSKPLDFTLGWSQDVYFTPTKDADGSYYVGIGDITAGYHGVFTISVRKVTVRSDGTFDDGYNSGYSDGLDDGKEIGYSDGFKNGVESVDTDKFYDDGYKDGVASVDKDAIYNDGYENGYNAGYQESYSKGFDDGYDSGYQAAMDRIEGWGADGTEYPVLICSFDGGSLFYGIDLFTVISYGTSYDYVYRPRGILNDFNINPNHIYKVVCYFDSPIFEIKEGYCAGRGVDFRIGSNSFPLAFGRFGNKDLVETVLYVRGDSMSSLFRYDFYVTGVSGVDGTADFLWSASSYGYSVYDCGPVGDTQNHIANQTDDLTHGFDSSSGNQANNEFASGVGDYQAAEDSLFDTATDGLKDFKFFDLNSIPAVVTGLSFVASLMTSIFGAMGGASGAGIVLSVLYCVVFVTIIIGLRRYYNSSGDVKDGTFRQLDESTLLEDKGGKR